MPNSIRVFASLLFMAALDSHLMAQLSEQLVITEVMWSSGHPGANDFGDGGFANGDWWELLNVSDQPVDMTGFIWDDDDRLVDSDFTIFPEFVIQPKELVLIVREDAETIDTEDGFRAVWDLPAGFRVLSETFFEDTGSGDTFSGLSGNGDEVNLYDADRELIQSVQLGVAETGFSLAWGFENGNLVDLGLSEAGEADAFAALSDGSGERLNDTNYVPPFLDTSSAGRVSGFDVIIPTDDVDVDSVCSAVASGLSTADDLTAALAAANIISGDANMDGAVGFPDFLVLSANFAESGHSFSGGDFDCDGSVGFPDFLLLSANFGQATQATSAVPEPNGFLLTMMGYLSVIGCIRSRRS